MPDDSWNPTGADIPLRRPFEIFVPNVCAIDMDTTGTWPFGRRLEDQVATRFLSLFLDMEAKLNGRPYHLESLNDQALWDAAPIVPKTPPNPLRNDKRVPDRVPLPRRASCRVLAPPPSQRITPATSTGCRPRSRSSSARGLRTHRTRPASPPAA